MIQHLDRVMNIPVLDFLDKYKKDRNTYSSTVTLFDPTMAELFSYCINTYKIKSILEIGFYYGASASVMLELNSDISVTSIDPGIHACTHEAHPLLKKRYKDRFNFILDDSKNLIKHVKDQKFDLAYIDGDHDPLPVLRDIKSCISLNIPYLLLDDIYEEITEKNYHPHRNVKNLDAASFNGVSIAIKQIEQQGLIEPLTFWNILENTSKVGLYKLTNYKE
jgi:hypothetical protein